MVFVAKTFFLCRFSQYPVVVYCLLYRCFFHILHSIKLLFVIAINYDRCYTCKILLFPIKHTLRTEFGFVVSNCQVPNTNTKNICLDFSFLPRMLMSLHIYLWPAVCVVSFYLYIQTLAKNCLLLVGAVLPLFLLLDHLFSL